MTAAHARPSRPGRAVLALAALALTSPAAVLGPRAATMGGPAATPDTTHEGQADVPVALAQQHTDSERRPPTWWPGP